MNCRGVPFEDEDDAYDYFRQRAIDEAEAKRRATRYSIEQLSIDDAFAEGGRAGALALSPALNPYQDHTPEHDAWERGRFGALTVRMARSVA